MQALAEKAKDLNISYLVIGLPSSADIWESFQKIREQNQDSPYVHIFLEFHQALSHVTFAAADFIFIPSIFEPCGLTQMIGIRYKTFPIVRKTGGLQDTVFDFDDAKIPIKKRCGFVFKNPVNQEMLETMQRALQFYQDKSRFQEGLQHLSSHTFSWEKPCKEYRRIYQKIMNV